MTSVQSQIIYKQLTRRTSHETYLIIDPIVGVFVISASKGHDYIMRIYGRAFEVSKVVDEHDYGWWKASGQWE